MNIQNDVIGLVLFENCKSKQMTDFIAWPSRCHDMIYVSIWYKYTILSDNSTSCLCNTVKHIS